MLKDFLEANAVKSEIVECGKEVNTAREAADFLHVSTDSITKSVLFFLKMEKEEEPVLIVLRGSKKVSLKKLKALFNARDARIAEPKEVLEVTGYLTGEVPPVSIYGVPTIIDEGLKEKELCVCGGGKRNLLLKISPKDIKEFGFEARFEDIVE